MFRKYYITSYKKSIIFREKNVQAQGGSLLQPEWTDLYRLVCRFSFTVVSFAGFLLLSFAGLKDNGRDGDGDGDDKNSDENKKNNDFTFHTFPNNDE